MSQFIRGNAIRCAQLDVQTLGGASVVNDGGSWGQVLKYSVIARPDPKVSQDLMEWSASLYQPVQESQNGSLEQISDRSERDCGKQSSKRKTRN